MVDGYTCWVIALPSEAKPLIDELNMTLIKGDTLFPIYKNKKENDWLIITGVGAINSAAGVSYLYSICPYSKYSFWINFGVAGAGDEIGKIGEMIFVNELKIYNSKKIYYPFIIPKLKIKNAMLKTYNSPENNYEVSNLFDMEGWAFYDIIQRKITRELIAVIKIISDNSSSNISDITKDFVIKLVQKKINYLIFLRQIGHELSKHEAKRKKDHYLFSDITKKTHFTFSQCQQLKKYLKRWQVLFPNKPLFFEIKDLNDAKSILDYLRYSLDRHHLKWE